MTRTHSIAAASTRCTAEPASRRRQRPGSWLARTTAAVMVSLAAVTISPQPTSAQAGTRTPETTAKAGVAVPPVPPNLPPGLEDLAPYVGQVSCAPAAKPGTLAVARLLTSTYPGTGYLVGQPCGSQSIATEHADGRAVDWLISARSPSQSAWANAFLSWLLAADSAGRPFANARRLGVMYVIWNNQIWGAYNPMAGWRPYSTCASHPEITADAICHRDRLQVSLSWAGALGRTSFWSKTVAPVDYGPCRPLDLNWAPAYTARNPVPCPSYPVVTAPPGASAAVAALVRFSGATVGPGDQGPVVTAVQRALGVVADGQFGPFTSDAVAALQRRHALAPSGAMDAATWRVLLAFVNGTPVSPTPPPVPTPAPNPLTKYAGTVLRYGSTGPAVRALQQRLKVPVTGRFGPKTRVAVVAFQVAVKLPATGVVDKLTWKALGA